MPIPDQNLVEQVLQANDRDVRCREAVEQAWDHCRSLADRAWWRRKSTSAALMWEYSVNNAVAAFADDPGVKVIAHQDTTSFIFDDKVLLRFKRAGLSLMSSNYPTSLANLFHSHAKDLFGFDGHHRVEIVHVPNRFDTALDWIGVVAREQKHILWDFELRSRGGAVVELPTHDYPKPAADTVLRPAKSGDERRDAEEN